MESGAARGGKKCKELGEKVPSPYCFEVTASAKPKEVGLPRTEEEELARAGKSGKCLNWADQVWGGQGTECRAGRRATSTLHTRLPPLA